MEAIQYVNHWRKKKVAKCLSYPRQQNRFRIIGGLCLGKTAIDVGCADGDYTFYLSNFYPLAKWIGLDFAKTFIDCARNNSSFKNIDWLFSPNYDLFSMLKKRIDTVVCSEVIEHVKEDRLLVENLWKITDKILIMTTPSIKVNDPGHLRIYNEDTLKKLFDGIPYSIFSNDIFYYCYMEK